jgi:HD-GYP domain-containing protein (c-di-GMP phosphodiesterase class II)
MAEISTPIRLDITDRWQGIIDLLAEIMRVPVVLIRRVEQSAIVVFLASRSAGNPYKVSAKALIGAGSYCETVIRTGQQKRTEEALRDSEKRLAAIISGSADAIVVVDQHGVTRFANPAAESLFTRKAEELLGASFGFPLVSGETTEIDIVRRDRKPTVAEMRVAETEWEGEHAYLASIRDISERARGGEEIKQDLEMLRKTSQGTVDALAVMAEMQDPHAAGHQRRVTQLACAIGREMGLPEDAIEALRGAAMLHDVGKIDVPADILSKPGPLTAEEMTLTRNYPRRGYDILKKAFFAGPIADIVLQHHERMDGSGCPSGLKGEGILVEARILAVADVVEAMCSHRAYRPGLGIEKAVEEISANRGVLYDPKAADACLKLFRENEFQFDPQIADPLCEPRPDLPSHE